MGQFMLLLRGGNDEMRGYSPEQFQELMQRYYAWTDQLRKDGLFKSGEPLKEGGRTLHRNGQGIVDGPFTETKEAVGGFYVIEAGSLDEAVAVAKGCPTLTHGGAVEVREIADITV